MHHDQIDDLLCNDLPPPRKGFFVDRFGIQTRVNYLPPFFEKFSGKVGGRDGHDNIPIHHPEEFKALFTSLDEAKERFVAMELGAGWGPWVSLAAVVAKRRDLVPILTGLEGSSDHVAFMRTHFADNAIDLAPHRIMHAVVGTYDGIARFPIAPEPSNVWGGEAKYEDTKASGPEVQKRGLSFWKRRRPKAVLPPPTEVMEEVACVSLKTLLEGHPPQDILHCDVQGAEAEVFEAAMEVVDAKVRRVCIGTHGRAIEERLMKLFAAHGWRREYDEACSFKQNDAGIVYLTDDGVQVWKNSRTLP